MSRPAAFVRFVAFSVNAAKIIPPPGLIIFIL